MSRSRSLTFLAALSVAVGLTAPPEARAAAPIKHPAEVSSPVKVDISPAAQDHHPRPGGPGGEEGAREPAHSEAGPHPGTRSKAGADAALQQRPGSTNMPAPIVNFEGNSNLYGVYPPDTTG